MYVTSSRPILRLFLAGSTAGAMFLAANASAGQLSLAWDRNRETNLVSYILDYYSKGSPYTNRVVLPSTVTEVTVTGLLPKTVYTFTLTARDIDGKQSAPSKAVLGSDLPPTLDEVADQIMVANTTLVGVPITLSDRETPDSIIVTAKGTPPWLLPDESIAISGTGTRRTLSVTPAPNKDGHGMITLIASDGSQEARTHFKLTVQPAHEEQSIGHIRTLGPGTVTPTLDGQLLNVGTRYTLTAVPDPNCTFLGWSGSVTSSSPVLTVVMQPALVLTARFMTNAFSFLAGSYSGLFAAETIAPETAGAFTFKVTPRGAYSGKLWSGRNTLAISGQLDMTGHSKQAALQFGSNVVDLELQFGPSDDTVVGTLRGGSGETQLDGARAIYSATNPAPFAGRFTEIFPGSPGSGDAPEGHGFATIKISPAGTATLVGSLADGTKFSQTATLVHSGDWPVYMAFNAKSTLWGWQNVHDQSGSLRWIRLAQPDGPRWPAGFSADILPVISVYLPPVGSTRIVGLEQTQLIFRDGAFEDELIQNITIDFHNRVTLTEREPPNPNSKIQNPKSIMKFTPATGMFSGKLSGADATVTGKFQGVVLQQQIAGAGFLIASNLSAKVEFGFR